MNKSDYDKYYKKGGTYVIPVELFNELYDELERQTLNYEQALEDLDKKENIIKEVRDLFYEKCRIKDSDGRYSFNETDIDEFRNLLDKEVN